MEEFNKIFNIGVEKIEQHIKINGYINENRFEEIIDNILKKENMGKEIDTDKYYDLFPKINEKLKEKGYEQAGELKNGELDLFFYSKEKMKNIHNLDFENMDNKKMYEVLNEMNKTIFSNSWGARASQKSGLGHGE